VRLSDAAGRELGYAAFSTGEAQALPGGARIALERTPALPLWPSAWTSLEPPRIDVGQMEGVARLTSAGPAPLPAAAVGDVARMLVGLSARDFVGGASVNWAGARQVRVMLADGSAIDLQQVPDGAGRYHLRMTSDSRTDVRAARRYAFRVADPLP
jgi:hypothetical protein